MRHTSPVQALNTCSPIASVLNKLLDVREFDSENADAKRAVILRSVEGFGQISRQTSK